MQMEGVACLGWKKSPGESARNSRNELPENVLSQKGLNKGRGKMVIFTVSNRSEKTQQNGLDETKKWALESPHLELWLKRYEGLKFRDFSAKISSQTSPWVDKAEAQS